MILHDDFINIKVGGLSFSSRNTSAPQFVLNPDAILGWTDGTGVKRSTASRPNAWGDFSEPGLRNSRLITVTGTAVATTAIELHQMRDAFMGILSEGQYGEFALQNKSGTRYATVALEGTPGWIQQIDTAAFWKLDLYAPDPRIYGEDKTMTLGTSSAAAGGLTFPLKMPLDFHTDITDQLRVIYNAGNTKSWPSFKVTGDLPGGFVISDNRGSIVRYEGPVSSYSPVTIDMGKGTAIQNDVDNSIRLSVRQWFPIEPLQSISPSFEPIITGPGWCDIIYRDTWI